MGTAVLKVANDPVEASHTWASIYHKKIFQLYKINNIDKNETKQHKSDSWNKNNIRTFVGAMSSMFHSFM